MRIRTWKAPSPALIISLIALFVALGGTTYAAVNLPANSVGSAQLKKNAVTAAKIKNGAITATKINTKDPATKPKTVANNPLTSTDPCASPTPQSGVFCGTSSSYWSGGLFAADHVQFWRDVTGVVHVAGEAHSSSTFSAGGSGVLFYLPPAYRPKKVLAFPVATGEGVGAFAAGSGMLVIYPANFSVAPAVSGAVALFSAGAGGREVVIGDVQFPTG